MIYTETQVKKQIKDLLCTVGAFPVPIWQGLMSLQGVSDILVCHDGLFVAIEVKKSNWRPPKQGTKAYKHYYEQKQFIERVKLSKGIGFFATSVEDVIVNLDLKATVYPLFERRR